MGEPRRKWGTRLRWVLPVLLAVYVLALYPPAWLRESDRDGGGGRSGT